MHLIVKDDRTLNFYSKEQQDDRLDDIQKASETIIQWKAHIMRSVNQECAKQDILAKLDPSSCLVVVDWAMKFLQLRYREKQSDWFGKRGLSWHISSVISRIQSGTTEVISYAHLFDQCTQDWYAVTSILEDLLNLLKVNNPLLEKVFLRSDEAGCYHNSSLLAAMRDVANRVGFAVDSYHYTEPQSGKDICDRILCQMNTSIRTYCNGGHDVLTALDMRQALTQHPVKETTAAVSIVNESKKTLSVNKKYITYDKIYTKHQDPTVLKTIESQGFYDPPDKREVKHRLETSKTDESPIPLFKCSVLGCVEAFETFAQLELHLDVGKHTVSKFNQYDAIRRDWALKFSSVNTADSKSSSSDSRAPQTFQEDTTASSPLQTGWALSKPRSTLDFQRKLKSTLQHGSCLEKELGARPILPKLQLICETPEMNRMSVCSLEPNG